MKTFIEKFGTVVFLLSVVILIIKGDFFSRSPLIIAGQLAALVLAIFSRIQYSKGQFRPVAEPGEGSLIQSGPYRVIRHPMYSAALLLVWTSIFGHWSPLNGLIGTILLIVILLRIRAEEQLLRNRYPEYADYSSRTRRLVPFIY